MKGWTVKRTSCMTLSPPTDAISGQVLAVGHWMEEQLLEFGFPQTFQRGEEP
jgi:hypothetical protein